MKSKNKLDSVETEILLESLEDIIQEYRRLSLIEEPSEQQSEKLLAILELAQYDNQVAEAIEKTDLEIAEELERRDKLNFYQELEQFQSLALPSELLISDLELGDKDDS